MGARTEGEAGLKPIFSDHPLEPASFSDITSVSPIGGLPIGKELAALIGMAGSLHPQAEIWVDRPLYALAEFFSKPPGFYVMLAAALVCALLTSATLGTYIISISAMCLTGVVLIQNYRDTSAMQAKLNEIIVALDAARNEVVGLEHASPAAIDAELKDIENRASAASSREVQGG